MNIMKLILRKSFKKSCDTLLCGTLLTIFHWSIILMIMTSYLWPLDYMSLTLLTLLCIYHLILPPLHCPVIEIHIIFTIYHWYSWYRFWVMYTELHTILHLNWLIKLTKLGLLGETVAGEIQRGVLGRATPYGFGCHTWSCYLCALLLLHATWYLSTVNCFSLLSGSTNTSLVWCAVVLWDEPHDGCIS